MALLAMEGFDASALKRNWTAPSDTYQAGRFGGFAHGTSGPVWNWPGATLGTVVVGFALRPALGTFTGSTANRAVLIVTGLDGVQHLTAQWLSTGLIEVRRGTATGTVIGTTSVAAAENVWRYWEFKFSIHDTTGTFIARLDGTPVLTLTNVDTKNAGTSPEISNVQLGGSGGNTLVDDAYILDTTGSAPYNDFLGDCRIETIVPNGAGASTQLTPSTGSNWAAVDELPASATDYVQATTAGLKDTYTFTDLVSTTGTVLAVQVSPNALKPDAGLASMSSIIRDSSGTEVEIGPDTLSATGVYYTTPPRITDASGAPWTISSVNSEQFGVKTV